MPPEKPIEEAIDAGLFAHLVQLAAFELDEDQAEYLRGELNKQLKAIDELEAIPLDEATPITSHGVPYTPQNTPPVRDDEWGPYPHPDAILGQAPQTEERYIVVPDIPHTELE